MLPDVVKSLEQALTKIGRLFKESVVRGFPPSVVPEPLLRVEFGRVFWQRKDFQAMALLFEPSPNLRMGVIRRIVLNEVNAVTAPVIGGQEDLLHKGLIG